ncbi:hypothetical protein ILUMI_20710 [Ignelater luminosus]|uniref:Ubiquitin carboxyl-terminal hydrolase n=1 Tax=Ignelater luminosus TaxID=2038154 RepID=A0A8K0CK92_IGNLU|nr:hypothetical protein ILUMI_20710 [Ignelater luminosus]
MPVLSPRRSSASALTGSYRSTFSSSSIDRPYYNSSNSYTPRINTYSERFSTRSYIDSDGRRVYSRQGSITEDGITTRFKEETREGSARRDSLGRDSGISSIRENSILDAPRRDSSLSRGESRSRVSAISVAESVAEMRNKYSPSNYVPACMRNNDNITRSKSINDIGKPPIERSEKSSMKIKVNDSFNYSNGLGVTNLSNNTNSLEKMCDNVLNEDDNGNRASVAEIRKKFDQSVPYKGSKTENLSVEGTGIKISENRFKKQDSLESLSTNKSKFSKSKKNDISAINKKNDSLMFINGHSMAKKDKILHGTENEKNDSLLESRNYEKRPAKLSKLEVNGCTSKQQQQIGSSKDKQQKQTNEDELDVTVGIESNFDSSAQKCPVSDINNFENGTKLNVSDQLNGTGALQNGHEVGRAPNDLHTEVESENNAEVSDNTEEFYRNFNHTSNFASYIPSKDLQQGDSESNEETRIMNGGDISTAQGNDMENRNFVGENSRYYQTSKINNDISASPRLNRAISQNASAASSGASSTTNNITSHNYQRATNSLEREEKARGSSPIKNQGLNGLKNIGNTCFMNSVIQCLSNTKLLLEYVKNDTYISDINTSISSMKGALIKAFSQVIKELWSEDSSDRVVNTLSLKSQIQRFAPRFMGYSQQDAQEFLRYLLEGLHEDVNRVTTKPTPILTEIDEKLSDAEKASESWQRYLRMDNSKVVDIFVGQLKSTLRCTHCGHCSVTFDPFWDLSLPIPQRAGQLRLQQCLDYFTREETLDGDEKPTCSKCKERRKCTKSFTIQKFPKILVIHLKRFSPTERFRGKLSVTIDFPLEGLDMRNYAAETSLTECRYNLYAISNHSGTTYSGHYTAYCRHPYSHAWHEYNDSRVSSISSKALVSGEAYVLFYELDNQKSHL